MKTILLIDDEKPIRHIYRRLIETSSDNNIKVLEADDAEVATRYLVRESIDLVILDIKMPNIDGKVMSEVVREYNPNLKVIIASVYPIEQQKKMIPDALAYFDKSAGLIRFLDRVSTVLDDQISGSLSPDS